MGRSWSSHVGWLGGMLEASGKIYGNFCRADVRLAWGQGTHNSILGPSDTSLALPSTLMDPASMATLTSQLFVPPRSWLRFRLYLEGATAEHLSSMAVPYAMYLRMESKLPTA